MGTITDTLLHKPATRNVTKAFRAATPEQRLIGRTWYNDARRLAEELVSTWGYGSCVVRSTREEAVEAAAAVIAVLSPRLSWKKNAELAQLAYRRYNELYVRNSALADVFLIEWPGLRSNAAKAFRILHGEDPAGVVSGPKVTTFWHQIVHPDSAEAVVIDRHAFDVAVGRVMTDEIRGRALGRKGAYGEFAEVYRRAAKILSGNGDVWTASQVQAVTWLYWRETHAAANHG